jgi:hypothetical protein
MLKPNTNFIKEQVSSMASFIKLGKSWIKGWVWNLLSKAMIYNIVLFRNKQINNKIGRSTYEKSFESVGGGGEGQPLVFVSKNQSPVVARGRGRIRHETTLRRQPWPIAHQTQYDKPVAIKSLSRILRN